MKQKLLAFLLVLSMAFGYCPPVMAKSYDAEFAKQEKIKENEQKYQDAHAIRRTIGSGPYESIDDMLSGVRLGMQEAIGEYYGKWENSNIIFHFTFSVKSEEDPLEIDRPRFFEVFENGLVVGSEYKDWKIKHWLVGALSDHIEASPWGGNFARDEYRYISPSVSDSEIKPGVWQIELRLPISFLKPYTMRHEFMIKVKDAMEQMNLNGKSEYEKGKQIFDYITNNVEYDFPVLVHYKYVSYWGKDDADSALLTGKAYCGGYATLTEFMMNLAGIDCMYMEGNRATNPHAWNYMQINGVYYRTDTSSNEYLKEKGDEPWLVPDITGAKHRYGYDLNDYNISDKSYIDSFPVCSKSPDGKHHGQKVSDNSDFGCNGDFVNKQILYSRCSYCGEPLVYTEKRHYFELKELEATCTRPGGTYLVCRDCGYTTLSSSEWGALNPKDELNEMLKAVGEDPSKPATGHTPKDEGRIILSPTCSCIYGVREHTCKTCGMAFYEKIERDSIKHKLSGEETVIPANCGTEGVVLDFCTECMRQVEVKTLPIDPDVHMPEEWTQEATCHLDGKHVTECLYCRKTLSEEILPATGTTEIRNKKEASCTEDGYTGDTYCKDCGELVSLGERIPAGHLWDEGTVIPPTCITRGYTKFTCQRCGKVKKTDIVDYTTTHRPEVKNAKKASCTEDGYTGDTYCADCGDLLSRGEVIPDTGHKWDSGTVTKQPTGQESGIRTYTCTVCGDTRTESIPLCEHQNTEVRGAKAATCKNPGYTGDTWCTDCGELISQGKEIPKLEHVWNDGVVTQEPTDDENGIRTYTCTLCGDTKTESIPKLVCSHQHTEIRDAKAATCKVPGYTGDTYCADCGRKIAEGEEIPKLEHVWDDGIITRKPKCTENGEKTFTCKNCGDTKTESMKATGHQHTETRGAKTAACTEPGYTGDVYCTDCGELISKGEEIPQLEHVWDDGVVTREPKCTEDGEKTFTCKNCGDTKTESIKAAGHIHTEIRNKKDASCEEDGYTGDTYCAICGEKLASGTIVKKTGHQWKDGVCQKCGKKVCITITGPTKTIAAGKGVQLKAVISPAVNTAVTWQSSSKKILSVSKTGFAKAGKKTGSAVITASTKTGIKASYKIKVVKGIVKKVAVTGPKTIKAGKTIRLKAKVTASKGAYKKVIWTSSNPKYATVDSKGRVKAKAKGKTVRITAAALDGSGKKGSLRIKIK